ncbi:uncharacterized protein CDV56_102637 [Aspergillus thermomutatus]|uniref:Aminoglycoside phosphotransferase domain-containing protein n=1 Tax=Aspergillus thermomutatus TaxID=41047 RepID=A0A397FYX8_ASPTH|nr:uncharacterized protein CDV56_102637 [Aspergillus thermomutatus]RHZ43885.1 hypothetical protein CDV56_102637 [Aspergillus thermomutatus]
MELVRARTDIPVPKVFGFKLDDANTARAAFILMEFLPGFSAMDAEGGYEAHWGEVPPKRRAFFFEQIARIQVQMSSIRLPRIGSVIRRDNNSFDVGPLPKIRGPFSTATEFFKAWAKHAKFPLSDEDIRKLINGGPTDSILCLINAFPSCLREMACRVSANDNGPFLLYHPDFYQSNIIVDESFRVLGVIDWEGACTVPWELVEPPLFLSMVPPAMDDPRNYEANGQPKDFDSRRRLNERAEYAKYVQKKEEELKGDDKLSQVLLDPGAQGLAHAIKVYHDPGKLEFYCKAIDAHSNLSGAPPKRVSMEHHCSELQQPGNNTSIALRSIAQHPYSLAQQGATYNNTNGAGQGHYLNPNDTAIALHGIAHDTYLHSSNAAMAFEGANQGDFLSMNDTAIVLHGIAQDPYLDFNDTALALRGFVQDNTTRQFPLDMNLSGVV